MKLGNIVYIITNEIFVNFQSVLEIFDPSVFLELARSECLISIVTFD